MVIFDQISLFVHLKNPNSSIQEGKNSKSNEEEKEISQINQGGKGVG